jgi:hypothetical protein
VFSDAITITAGGSVGSLTYKSNGMLDSSAAVTFVICHTSIPNDGRQIKITPTGRAAITDTEYNCN